MYSTATSLYLSRKPRHFDKYYQLDTWIVVQAPSNMFPYVSDRFTKYRSYPVDYSNI